MYKLVFYVPLDAAEIVKEAIFNTGAGKLGKYAQCCWQTQGFGQFMPLEGTNPSIGSQGSLEVVKELRVEILCTEDNIEPAIQALKGAHPYEEVAYEVISIENHKFE